MSRRRTQQGKQRDQQPQQELDESVEDMATRYNCAMEAARDFADQCSERLDDLAYDLDCSRIARDMWSEAPAHAAPLVDVLRALAAEHERHDAAIADLRRRMIELGDDKAIHHHLDQQGRRSGCKAIVTLTYIQAPHEPRKNHIVDVLGDMGILGAPTIHAWWAGDHWRALEGSHRLAAAHARGLTPIIIEMSEDDEMDHDFLDVRGRRVADLLEHIRRDGPRYGFANLKRGS